MLKSALGYLAAADATAMAAETRARCLRMLEQAHAVGTAARTSVLAAFTAGQGYSADGDYSPRAWLINRTRITKGAAAGYTGWVRRAAAHPGVIAAMAAEEMSESFARMICSWTDKLPEQCRPDADEILLAAARAGMGLPELTRAGRGDLRPVPVREPGRRPGHGVRGPGGAAGDHLRWRRGAARGPDAGVRRGGRGGAGCAVGPGRGGGYPQPGAAVP